MMGQADGRQPTVVVLDRANEGVASADQGADKFLSRTIPIDHDGHVNVCGKAWVCSCRYRKAPDQCPPMTRLVEVTSRPPKRSLQFIHSNLWDGRPGASPSGAPGRDLNQDATRDSISSADALGFSLRRRARCMRTPNSYMSKARRNRRAVALSVTSPVY